jgi:hypothetical protein
MKIEYDPFLKGFIDFWNDVYKVTYFSILKKSIINY